ncbi:hypothetical protein KIN20_036914 [Parelaphostrongylus tenuis]|uniref:Uncharacterized protein n=1 Tax=Parelaphostrongylus tenuis TaxID=148309 RepID=A0AAD5RDN5_PARTN|nr:hypothetical protein KIN20_036914 [Parelaphostrongylus tenuis]
MTGKTPTTAREAVPIVLTISVDLSVTADMMSWIAKQHGPKKDALTWNMFNLGGFMGVTNFSISYEISNRIRPMNVSRQQNKRRHRKSSCEDALAKRLSSPVICEETK